MWKSLLYWFVLLGSAAGLGAVGQAVATKREPPRPVMVTAPPAEQPPLNEAVVVLVWVSPEGVKLYKVSSTDAIVPAYVAVHPSGAVSVR